MKKLDKTKEQLIDELVKDKKIEQRLNNLLTIGPAVIYTSELSGDYKATFISGSVKTQMGYEPNEFIDDPKFWVEHIHPDDVAQVIDGLKVLHEKGYYEHEYRFLHKDGIYRWMHDEVRLSYGAEGKPIEAIGCWVDITERKRIEEEKERLQSQLVQAQKMEAIGTMAGGIAHDFNNIMTVVKNMASLALRKADKDGDSKKYLELIRDVSERAINLVQQLLIFSQSKPAEHIRLNLNDILTDLLSMIRNLISEDIAIENKLEGNLRMIDADRVGVEQVLTNLLLNSSEAMPQGGQINIHTNNITFSEEEARAIKDATPGDYVCLTVEDTGVGMDVETKEHIFEPFFTTKSPEGTGLGLSVVYGVINKLNGWIDVSSEPGKGSRFSVYIPVSTRTEEAPAEDLRKRETIDGKGQHILLVEDDKWVRKSTAMVLSEHGYKVSEASDAEKAIALFYKEKGKFDLILSDVVMPGRSGVQMLDPLLDINPNIPVLFFSGYVDDKSQLKEIIKRGIAYIHKPFEMSDLLKAVEEIIAQES